MQQFLPHHKTESGLYDFSLQNTFIAGMPENFQEHIIPPVEHIFQRNVINQVLFHVHGWVYVASETSAYHYPDPVIKQRLGQFIRIIGAGTGGTIYQAVVTVYTKGQIDILQIIARPLVQLLLDEGVQRISCDV